MDLLNHFDEQTGTILLYVLKTAERDDFLSKLPSRYALSYISPEELEFRIDNFTSTKENEYAEILPDKGNIKSGDFGEILAYHIFKERHEDKNVDGPLKWRWKQEKNVAAPYTDVILYSVEDLDNPSPDDILISVESKMKATDSNLHPIQDAIDGAEKDFVSRIANSLSWLRKKYKEEAFRLGALTPEISKTLVMIERFINSETKGKYIKKVKAVAIIDKAYFGNEIAKVITIPNNKQIDLTVVAISIDRLKEAYEYVLSEVPSL